MSSLRPQWNALQSRLAMERRILVAFSGGCDSTFLLAAARRALGKEKVLAATAVSASLAESDRLLTAQLAKQLDVAHRFIETQELENPNYVANPSNRCYFCKDELFNRL